jgi:4,5-DOPA dioxygenase extradiol
MVKFRKPEIPALFISHGAPSMLMEESNTNFFLRGLGQSLTAPRAILCISAHWATHNLREFQFYERNAPPVDYAWQFNEWLKDVIPSGKEMELLDYLNKAPHARRNHPTPEHFLPIFTAIGAATKGITGRAIHSAFQYGVLSLAAFAWD